MFAKGTYDDLQVFLELMQQFPHRSAKLNPTAFQILAMFSVHEYLSAYEIYTRIQKERKISYKNIRKAVLKLVSLNLITKVSGEKLSKLKKTRKYIHKPIFYELTFGGIFNILSTGRKYVSTALFEHFPQNAFLKTFLSLFFAEETIKQVEHTLFLKIELIKYLENCCKIAEMYESSFRTFQNQHFIHDLDLDANILENDSKLLLFLNEILTIDINNATIKRNRNNSIDVTCGQNLISVTPYRKTKYSITLDNMITMVVERVGPKDNVLSVDEKFRSNEIFDSMLNELQLNMATCALYIMLRITGTSKMFYTQAKDESILLSQDKKFSNFLKQVLEKYNKAHHDFKSLTP